VKMQILQFIDLGYVCPKCQWWMLDSQSGCHDFTLYFCI